MLAALTIMLSTVASAVTIKSNAPETYTVKEGDTLWAISGLYLDEPWHWKRLWAQNRQIKNPHLIYPGDQIHFKDGTLSITRAGGGNVRAVRLTPEMREVPLDTGVPALSYNQLSSTVVEMEFLSAEEIKELPYIIASEDQRIMGTKDRRVYISEELEPGKVYNIYAQGETYKAKRGQNYNVPVELGTELIKTGEVRIERNKDGMATGNIIAIDHRGPRDGHRLILKEKALPSLYFEPKAAPHGTAAQIIGMPNALASSAKGATVILDRGIDAGIHQGDVLLAQTDSLYTRDPYTNQKVALPSEAVATIMVYKVFDQVSLGLIMEASDRVKIGSYAVTPHSGR